MKVILVIEIPDPDPIPRLKSALKSLRRRHGIRCVRAREETDPAAEGKVPAAASS